MTAEGCFAPLPLLCTKRPRCICEHRSIARKVAKKKNQQREMPPTPTPQPLLDKRLSSGLVIGSFQMEIASSGAGEQVHPQRSKLQFTRRQGIKRGKGLGCVDGVKEENEEDQKAQYLFFPLPPTQHHHHPQHPLIRQSDM